MKSFWKPLLVLLLSNTLSFSQSDNTDTILNGLDKYIEKAVKDWSVPGVSVGIVKDGAIIFEKGYGTKTEGENDKPNEHTLYAIASNSKAFTTAIIAMLVQEEKLDWDDKVQDILPYFELYDPDISNMVNIRDLLCHRVGLGTFSGDVIWYKAELTPEEVIKRIKHLPPAYEFRDGYGYSNLMYITAGAVIEKITGKSWYQNVKERILDPLGMERTTALLADLDDRGNYATPHTLDGKANKPIPWANWEQVAATGGLVSSVHDIGKWMIFNLNHGILDGDTLLTPRSRNTIWKPHNNFYIDQTMPNDLDMNFNSYGLGWGLREVHGRFVARHTGGYDGMLSAIHLVPEENLGVVVLTNGMRSPFMAISYKVLSAFMGEDNKDWSADFLNNVKNGMKSDTRIEDRKAARIQNTKPTHDLAKYTGTYHSDIYGKIYVTDNDGQLSLEFEHTPALSAKLYHWHYDVWEIKWEEDHAWFTFGTVKFEMDNNLKVIGMEFDVPNDDIFFEELKPVKVD